MKLSKMSAILVATAVLLTACAQNTPAPVTPAAPAEATPAPAEPATPAEPAAPAETGSKVEENAVIKFALWDENQSPVFEQISRDFEAKFPGVKVEVQLTPWSQYWTKLDAAASSGNAADVFWMNVYMPKYADANVIMPINDLVARDGLDMSQWTPAITQLYTYNGNLYGMPKGQDVVNVYYNTAIFDKYGVSYPQKGWTWDDMKALGAELRDAIAAQGGDEYALVMELDQQPSYFNFIWQEGGYIISEDKSTSGFGMAESKKAVQDVIDLMTEKIMPDYKVLSDTKGTDLFLAQKAAMVFAGSWKASVIDEASWAATAEVIEMPEKAKNNDSVLGGLSFAINATTKYPEASWEFVKYLAGMESNRAQAEAKIDLPAYLPAQEYYVPNFVNLDVQPIIDAARSSNNPFPTDSVIADWLGLTNDSIQEAFAGNMSASDACDRANADMQEILDNK